MVYLHRVQVYIPTGQVEISLNYLYLLDRIMQGCTYTYQHGMNTHARTRMHTEMVGIRYTYNHDRIYIYLHKW